jgi:hypothetical protein
VTQNVHYHTVGILALISDLLCNNVAAVEPAGEPSYSSGYAVARYRHITEIQHTTFTVDCHWRKSLCHYHRMTPKNRFWGEWSKMTFYYTCLRAYGLGSQCRPN